MFARKARKSGRLTGLRYSVILEPTGMIPLDRVAGVGHNDVDLSRTQTGNTYILYGGLFAADSCCDTRIDRLFFSKPRSALDRDGLADYRLLLGRSLHRVDGRRVDLHIRIAEMSTSDSALWRWLLFR